MATVLVIPDIHLKTQKILPLAEKLMQNHPVDTVVFLGDYFDDWNQLTNASLYSQTMADILTFNEKYNCHFILGNHDAAYILKEIAHYSTPLVDVQSEIYTFLKTINPTYAIEIDNVIYSHAGVLVDNPKFYQSVFTNIAALRRHYHDSYSPLWLRPYQDIMESINKVDNPLTQQQIVGHTPMAEITTNGRLTLTDVFSTFRNGTQVGLNQFVIVTNGKPEVITL